MYRGTLLSLEPKKQQSNQLGEKFSQRWFSGWVWEGAFDAKAAFPTFWVRSSLVFSAEKTAHPSPPKIKLPFSSEKGNAMRAQHTYHCMQTQSAYLIVYVFLFPGQVFIKGAQMIVAALLAQREFDDAVGDFVNELMVV